MKPEIPLKDIPFLSEKEKEAIKKSIGELIKSEVKENFTNSEYYTSFKDTIFRFIKQEIRVALDKKGLYSVIRGIIKETFQEQYSEIIKEVIQETLKKLNKNLSTQEKRTRNLALSIDSNIKHIMRNPELSLDTQECIKEVIYNTVKNVVNNKMIENQPPEVSNETRNKGFKN